MWFIIVTLQDLVNNESRMLSDCITDGKHSYKWAVREAELWTPLHSQLSGQTHHLEAPSYNLMGRFQRKVHSAWQTTHILALFTPGNPTGQLEVKLPRHGSDDNAPPGLWPRSPTRSKVKSPYEKIIALPQFAMMKWKQGHSAYVQSGNRRDINSYHS